jgi:hypothetical protein
MAYLVGFVCWANLLLGLHTIGLYFFLKEIGLNWALNGNTCWVPLFFLTKHGPLYIYIYIFLCGLAK